MIADWRHLAFVKSLFYLVILAGLTSGCSTRPGSPAGDLAFEIQGKVSIVAQQKGRSARFKWQQYAHGVVIEVWGPLGQGRVRMQGNDRAMVLTRGEEVVASGQSKQVMQDNLGWYLPIDVLSSWLIGMPHPDFAAKIVDPGNDSSHPVVFIQAGWQVTLDRFQAFAHRRAPTKIQAIRPGYKVTLVTKTWLE